MYDELCKLYGLDPAQRIWNGKTAVYAFANEAEYRRCQEVRHVAHVLEFADYGVCQANADGTVTISCFTSENHRYFAAVLVHETTHGFNHFYRTECRLPNWIDEGAAEWVADRVLGGSPEIHNKEAAAVAEMRRTRSLGGDFFTRDQIQPWQYGAAFGITSFLVNYDAGPAGGKTAPRAARGKPATEGPYRKFINAIKDGAHLGRSPQAGLQDDTRTTRPRLRRNHQRRRPEAVNRQSS